MSIFDETDLTNTKGAAKYCDCAAGSLAIMRHEGTGPAYIKHGRYVRYRRIDLEDWIHRGRIVPKHQDKQRQR